MLLSLKHRGDQGRFLMAGEMPVSHPFSRRAKEEDSGSCKPHLCSWESYGANLLEAIASHTIHKPTANSPYGFTKGDPGTVDKEEEGRECCTL